MKRLLGALGATAAATGMALAPGLAPAALADEPKLLDPLPPSGEKFQPLTSESLLPTTTPEIGAGESVDGKASLAAVACPSYKQCAWTGTYRSGAGIGLTAGMGSSTNWNTLTSSYCTGSTSGGTWKNCASSLENNNATFNFSVYVDLNGGGAWWQTPPGDYYSTLWSTLDNNIESSTGL